MNTVEIITENFSQNIKKLTEKYNAKGYRVVQVVGINSFATSSGSISLENSESYFGGSADIGGSQTSEIVMIFEKVAK